MNVVLNNPHKPRNKMTRRERFATMKSEVEYAIELICIRISKMQEELGGHSAPKIFVTCTTPHKQREVLARFFAFFQWPVRVVVGRTSIFDSDKESDRRTLILSSYHGWEQWKDEIEDLLESFTVLIDCKTLIDTPKGKHGQYCRWTQPLESDLTLVIKTITGKYGVK